MDKMQRFMAAARGERVDAPPVGSWIHFGSALWEPELSADVHLRFLRAYDWDYLKVMDDYRFPTEGGLREAATVDDLRAIGGAHLPYDNFDRQMEVLRRIKRGAPDVPTLDTVFSPFQTVIRALGDGVVPLFKAHPEAAHEVIGMVADRLADFVRASAGVTDGIFFAVNGACADADGWGLDAAQFADWVAPYDKRVLEAAGDRVRVIHVHGYDLIPEWVDDYPAEVMSWSHNQSRPTLGEVARAGRYVPMGGLDEVGTLYWAPSKVRANVLASRRETGDRLIVAPGCTLHSDTPPAIFHALAAAARMPLPAGD
ncbi:uroporphyrinogen decarboxylase family protein [Castellaniella defragrans]|uniref:uroporphyrinogen decarboxylase family protein n=1 Tax=Castellaniella defragrans TaxID=75697 RepID=UPI0023F581AB|nr:uroporphyrinogen decarboxylase family protein [Castellaniella defragrans]